ncbi:autotransporter assembly complex family protein [Microbaculum marinum]|uniref:Autotransporter assembly complex family protein n=1 Tax=Microbaculum marinum TaxID=1764581 RepID=A0AAW9S573_9HYPH
MTVAAGLWTLASVAAPTRAQDAQAPDAQPEAESEASAATTAPGIPYTSTIEVTGGTDALKTNITDTSNLKALEGEPPAGPVGLVRRAAADMQRIQAALNAGGFYGGLINITVAGVPVADQRAVDAAAAAALRGPVPVVVRVEAGPQFVFGVIELADAATGQPPAPLPIDVSALGLAPGTPARAALVLTAEGRIVDQMQDLGYPLARVASRRAVADHSNDTLDVTFFLEPGRQANLGTVEVRGATSVDPQFVEHMANVKPGTRYSRQEVERIRDEVARLDIFQSVRIIEGDSVGPDGTIPLIIQVDERKPRFVGIGASYSSTEGGTVNGYWGHRNLFGQAEKLRIEGEVSRLFSNSFTDLQYVAKATFEKPGFVTSLDDLLIEARAFHEVPEAYESTGGGGQVAWRRRFTDEFEGRIGASVEHERITDALGTNTYTLVGIPVSARYDSTDDKLDPSKGIRAIGEVTPYPSFLGSSVNMTRLEGSVSTYHSFDAAKRFILAGRILAGTVIGPDSVAEIPADKRFYAGGGGTIRGYDYQGVSPRLPNGEIIGGKHLFVASAEARLRVTDTIGIVPFVDAGGAFSSGTPTFGSEDFKVGAGLGLRYYTAIGPIRFDVAVPLERGPWDPSVAFYVGLGQSF